MSICFKVTRLHSNQHKVLADVAKRAALISLHGTGEEWPPPPLPAPLAALLGILKHYRHLNLTLLSLRGSVI